MLFRSIVLLCVCVCSIAIGVYSAKTASLNVSGTIGFTAHNCKVNISAYMYGYSLTPDGEPVAKPTQDSEKQYLIYGSSKTKATESAPLLVDGGTESLSFNINTGSYSGVYFSDMGESGEVEPIKIVLTLTNISSYTIYFEDTTTSPTNCTAICDNPLNVLYTDTSKNSITLTYTVTLNANSNGTYSNLSTPVNLTLGMNFSKLDTNISSTGFTLSGTTITDVPAQSTSDLLVIPSKFSDKSGETYTTLGYDIISNLQGYSKVIILDGITTIGGYVFSNCVKLKAVCIPNSVTSLKFLSFASCDSLTSVKLPDGIREFNSAFSGCNSLVSINIPYGVGSLGEEAFSGCTSLTQLIIPDTVTDIENNVFRDCTNLTSITIPSRVKTIQYGAFENCKKLTSITIPASVTYIWCSAFPGCTNLTSITFENPDNWQYSTKYSGPYNDFTSDMSFTDPAVNATKLKGDWVDYYFQQKGTN